MNQCVSSCIQYQRLYEYIPLFFQDKIQKNPCRNTQNNFFSCTVSVYFHSLYYPTFFCVLSKNKHPPPVNIRNKRARTEYPKRQNSKKKSTYSTPRKPSRKRKESCTLFHCNTERILKIIIFFTALLFGLDGDNREFILCSQKHFWSPQPYSTGVV